MYVNFIAYIWIILLFDLYLLCNQLVITIKTKRDENFK